MKTLLTPSHSIGPSVEGSMCGFSPGGTYSSHAFQLQEYQWLEDEFDEQISSKLPTLPASL